MHYQGYQIIEVFLLSNLGGKGEHLQGFAELEENNILYKMTVNFVIFICSSYCKLAFVFWEKTSTALALNAENDEIVWDDKIFLPCF